MSKIEGKVCFITGASSGIGYVTGEVLAKKGAKVILTARREERLKELAENLSNEGYHAEYKVLDVTDSEAFKKAVDDTVDKHGRIDVLFNNAGVMPLSFMDKLKTGEWNMMVDVNIKGVLNGIAAVMNHMKKQNSGHILNTSSVAGKKVFPGGGVYCATKYAVEAISESLKIELSKETNIKVSTISPGPVKTELTQTITDEDILEKFDARKGMLEPLESMDIANGVVYALEQPDNVNISDVYIKPVNYNM